MSTKNGRTAGAFVEHGYRPRKENIEWGKKGHFTFRVCARKEKLTMPIALSHEVSNWANAFPIASRSSRPLTNQDLSQTDWPATKGLRYTKSRQKDEIRQATQEEKDSEESSGTNV
ncbi:uncharacterized protein PADG_11386 [Paracoccidioides brasiliensis Pb18]|uniref:Uncharacterized protein n=1 Tax=Paracoccidioides brasiliensis (strain Pb18) TaxID=502780 RepID=A0A0A0HVD9_PARBD|nr:uncharacterized protein PADG_11386 [Paracoccidioides brasiliensis Pb18]KGM92557.1 hypothetical protein PADG_11386 [Paracoccidioides brasiliensis Pb18]